MKRELKQNNIKALAKGFFSNAQIYNILPPAQIYKILSPIEFQMLAKQIDNDTLEPEILENCILDITKIYISDYNTLEEFYKEYPEDLLSFLQNFKQIHNRIIDAIHCKSINNFVMKRVYQMMNTINTKEYQYINKNN